MNETAPQDPRPAADKTKPDLILRGSRRNSITGQQDATVLLFATQKPDQFSGFVIANGEKHQVICQIHERKPDKVTGETKPNYLVLYKHVLADDEEDLWETLGHGNAMNRRSDGKPVYFDEVLFNVGNEIISARLTQKVDASLQRQLGFESPRVERPEHTQASRVSTTSEVSHSLASSASP